MATGLTVLFLPAKPPQDIERELSMEAKSPPLVGTTLVAVGIDPAHPGWSVIGRTRDGLCVAWTLYTGSEAIPHCCDIFTLSVGKNDSP